METPEETQAREIAEAKKAATAAAQTPATPTNTAESTAPPAPEWPNTDYLKVPAPTGGDTPKPQKAAVKKAAPAPGKVDVTTTETVPAVQGPGGLNAAAVPNPDNPMNNPATTPAPKAHETTQGERSAAGLSTGGLNAAAVPNPANPRHDA